MFAKQQLQYQAIALPAPVARTDAEILQQAQLFQQQMQSRRTVRDYQRRPVPQAVIESCILTAGSAPSGANHQPWHFVAVSDPLLKQQIRAAAEAEERVFYQGGAGDEWLKALEPIGTGVAKPHLEDAAWLIVVFAQRWGQFSDGTKYKNYYVPESVGIATGFLIAAIHQAGLSCLTHTPNPMKFLNSLLGRPEQEKPVMILAVGHPAPSATVPAVALLKKPLAEILSLDPKPLQMLAPTQTEL